MRQGRCPPVFLPEGSASSAHQLMLISARTLTCNQAHAGTHTHTLTQKVLLLPEKRNLRREQRTRKRDIEALVGNGKV